MGNSTTLAKGKLSHKLLSTIFFLFPSFDGLAKQRYLSGTYHNQSSNQKIIYFATNRKKIVTVAFLPSTERNSIYFNQSIVCGVVLLAPNNSSTHKIIPTTKISRGLDSVGPSKIASNDRASLALVSLHCYYHYCFIIFE